MKTLPPLAYLRSNFTYDPETGAITLKGDGGAAFNTVSDQGYLRGKANGARSPYYAHRIAWKIHYGREPGELDHINGNRADNRIANLREVTRTQNQRNRSLCRNNTSGFSGVRWHSRDKRWSVWIGVGGERKYLGTYVSKDQAIAVRQAAERELDYKAA